MHPVITATLATAIATGAAAPGVAQTSQKFPSKPIRLVVGLPAGSQADTMARLVGQKMSEGWGRPVVVDNRPGAGGALAAGSVAKAAPDGHTLLYSSGFAINAALKPNLPYDPLKDFAGITQIGFPTQVLVATPALGVTSLKDFIALARSQPGKIIYGSPPVGTSAHLSGARFNLAAGIKAVTVAFKGAPEAAIEVLAGRTHYSMVTLVTVQPFIREGKLLALGVTAPQRSPLLPDVPALAETLPDFKRSEASSGLLAPAGTPRPVLNQIGKEVARILDLPDVKERLNAFGYHAEPSTPEQYDRIVRDQIETLSRVARDAGLRAQ